MRTGTIACAGISLINPKTGAAKLIGRGDKPRWSPDGLLLTYNNHTTIMVYDSQKGTSKALVDGTVIGWLRRDRPLLLIDSPINGKSGYYRFDVKTGLYRFLAKPKMDLRIEIDLSPSTYYLAESNQDGITFTDTRSGKQQFIKPKYWAKKVYGSRAFWGASDSILYYKYYKTEGAESTWRKLTLRFT